MLLLVLVIVVLLVVVLRVNIHNDSLYNLALISNKQFLHQEFSIMVMKIPYSLIKFDKVFEYILNLDFEILWLNTSATTINVVKIIMISVITTILPIW